MFKALPNINQCFSLSLAKDAVGFILDHLGCFSVSITLLQPLKASMVPDARS